MSGETERYKQEIGHIFSLLHQAIVLKEKAAYQPPHWDHKPTPEELAMEKEYQDEVKEACEDVKALASQIYLFLTGSRPNNQ